ncbi:hypothetical protein K469DRAFT_550888, partial [Zopfia rhizophila CBS 207.26]
FISSGKAFLSALAVAEAEDLKVVCSKLLPHKLTFDRTLDSLTPTWEISQATQSEHLPSLGFTEDSQPSETFVADSSPPSRPTRPTLQPTMAETLCDQDLFATYTTLEDYFPIIRLGDSFLRVDIVSFLEHFRLGWSQNGFWYRLPLSNPTPDGTTTERLFKSFHCAELLEQGSSVDPVRLRIARIILYHYYEQLCVDSRSNPTILGRRSRGRDTASVATDRILESMYNSSKDQTNPRIWKQRRDSLQKHKKIGKRWSMLAAYLGIGILLACNSGLESQM